MCTFSGCCLSLHVGVCVPSLSFYCPQLDIDVSVNLYFSHSLVLRREVGVSPGMKLNEQSSVLPVVSSLCSSLLRSPVSPTHPNKLCRVFHFDGGLIAPLLCVEPQ